MNSKSLLIAFFVVFLAQLPPVGAKLTRVPSDTQASMGDSVRLQCFTENKEYPPSWSHLKVGSTEPSDVYMTVKNGQNMIVGRMAVEYYGRFKVHEDRTTGEYSLSITDVQLGDAGRYMCTARGGLGQQATAELGVIETNPQCASNVTEAIGENVCNREPDHVGFSCSFRYNGNALPSVNWVKTDQPGRVVRIEEAHWTGGRRTVVSNFAVRADTEDLNDSSYMCVVSTSSDGNDKRVSCTTPAVNVLTLANATESRTLDHPEEVQCNTLPDLPKTGCKWVKQNPEEDIVVTEGSLLNLYRPEFESGIYVCIVEGNILGQRCSVKALTINYEPGPSMSKSAPPPSTGNLVIILAVVVTVVVIVAIVVFLIVRSRKHTASTRSGPAPTDLRAQTNRSSNTSNNERPETSPLTGQDDHVAVDITDASRASAKQGDRELGNRLIEEKARARMRQNAAVQQGTDNRGFSSLPDDGDVAEGIGRSAEKDKDE